MATKWNLTLAEENRAVILPEWGKKCGACGYTGHTFRFYGKGVVCPTILNKPKGEFLCTYSLCKQKGLHTTRVCPTLHALCATCGCRGHFSGCNPTSEAWMAEVLQTFQALADQGVWTSLCFIRMQWGFFPVAFEWRKNNLRDYKGCLFPNLPRPYSYFLHCPVLEPLEALRQCFGGKPKAQPLSSSSQRGWYAMCRNEPSRGTWNFLMTMLWFLVCLNLCVFGYFVLIFLPFQCLFFVGD